MMRGRKPRVTPHITFESIIPQMSGDWEVWYPGTLPQVPVSISLQAAEVFSRRNEDFYLLPDREYFPDRPPYGLTFRPENRQRKWRYFPLDDPNFVEEDIPYVQLYFDCLCNLLNTGRIQSGIENETGRQYYMLPNGELTVGFGETADHLRYISLRPEDE